jgi:acetyl-CoA carboxylase biotin carboxyl carrier protein
MDILQRVKELIGIMTSNDLSELEVEQPEFKIRIRKTPPPAYPPPPFMHPGHSAVPWAASEAGRALQAGQGAQSVPAGPPVTPGQEGLTEVTSPMVGTFYRSSTPGSGAYVDEGSTVEPDTVVCIIEAMKVMNEIKAEVSGEIVEVCVEDTEPVEFGQVLFRVRPHSG